MNHPEVASQSSADVAATGSSVPARPRLTLCMIVRDEEAMLPGCLQSVQGVVDEIVVVDTGSVDRTKDIAREAGAKILELPWHDDFAQARNAAVAPVKEGFVLLLDADERLAPGTGANLLAALRDDNFDCGLLALHDATDTTWSMQDVLSGAGRRCNPVVVPRVFRRTPDLKWEGVVHEQVTNWLLNTPRFRVVDTPIVHYGGGDRIRSERKKNERNLRLLEKRALLEPENAVVRAYLARELLRVGNEVRAGLESTCAWSTLVKNAAKNHSKGGVPDENVVLVASVHVYLLLRAQRLEMAAEVLAQAREWTPAHPNLDFLSGLTFEHLARVSTDVDEIGEALLTARDAYRRCLGMADRLFPSETLPGATSWSAHARLGIVQLMCAEPLSALEHFEHALRGNSSLMEAVLGRLEARLDLGAAQEVLRELKPLVELDLPDAWLLAADIAAGQGSLGDAATFALRARQAAASKPWVAPHRYGRLLHLEARVAQASNAVPAA